MSDDANQPVTSELFKTIVEQSSDGVLLFTDNAQLYYINEQGKSILNLHSAHLNVHASELLPKRLFRQLGEPKENRVQKLEFRCDDLGICSTGIHWLESAVDEFSIDGIDFQQLTLKDVTNSKQKESFLMQQATTDDLSGLSNRRCFRKILDDNQDESICLAVVDVDHFKTVNDKFGHAAGDSAIRFVAAKLLEFFSDTLCVARLGGEEFAVVAKAQQPDDVLERFEAFRTSLQSESFSDEQHKITVSIGLAFADLRAGSVSELLKRADKALYESKDAGRNCTTVFK